MKIFTPFELAQTLGVSERTLNRWHALRKGPARIKVGNFIGYRESAVEEWLINNETKPLQQ